MTLPVLEVLGELQRDPAASWLVDAVEAYHAATVETRDSRGWFHASQLGQTDDVLLAQYAGTHIADVSPGLRRVFDLGHARDRDWKRYLKAAGLSAIEAPEDRHCMIEPLRLKGECDDVVRHPETGQLYVFEFKTINPYGFGMLRAPQPAHVLQTHVYMAAIGLTDAILLYENKASQALLPFYVPFNIETWTAIVMRIKRLLREAQRPLRAVPSEAARRQAQAMEV